MAIAGSGSLATILSLYVFHAALLKGRTFKRPLSERRAHFARRFRADADPEECRCIRGSLRFFVRVCVLICVSRRPLLLLEASEKRANCSVKLK